MTEQLKQLNNLIGGKWVPSSSSHSETVFNPATGEAIHSVPLSTFEDIDQAVQAAQWPLEHGVRLPFQSVRNSL